MRAFSRHGYTQRLEGINTFRRLRILYNRIKMCNSVKECDIWVRHLFDTGYGPRNVLMCYHSRDPRIGYDSDTVELYYEDNGKILFYVKCTRTKVNFIYNYGRTRLTDEAIWKAIEELEELSYPLLERYMRNK